MDQNTRKMFQRGVESVKAGDKATARRLLLQVTAHAPEHQDAWLWLSDVARTRYERREYLEHCVAQDPQSRAAHIARKKLTRLEWELLVAEDDPISSIQAPPAPMHKHPRLSIWKTVVLVGISLLLLWSGMAMVFNYLGSRPAALPNQIATNTITASLSNPPSDETTTAPYPVPTSSQAVSAQTMEETPTATLQPSAVPYPAEQPTSRVQEPSVSVVSRGLGLERSQWEAMHGAPEQESADAVVYADGRYRLSFHESKIESLHEQWPTDAPVSLEEARMRSQQLLPGDREFVATFAAPDNPETTIDIYQSTWLHGRFSDWAESEPGAFIVIYRASGDMIYAYHIQVGDVR
jgi:hypothetical protein